MISQIARIQLEEAHRDDSYPRGVFVTPRSKEREARRRARELAQSPELVDIGARAAFQEPLMFSRRWAATEIQRVWRGFVNPPRPFAYFGELSRKYLARWRAVLLIQRVWRGYVARCALPIPATPVSPRLLDVGLYDASAADQLQFGCQFPHQCGHRGRGCALRCPNNPLQARAQAPRAPPCEKCQGSGYYTVADARGASRTRAHRRAARKTFMICRDCNNPLSPDAWV